MQIKNILIDIEMYNGRNMDIDTYQKKKKEIWILIWGGRGLYLSVSVTLCLL